MSTNTVDGGDVVARLSGRIDGEFDPEQAQLCFERARSFERLADSEQFSRQQRALWARRAERAREQFKQETGVEYRSLILLR